MKRIVKSSMEKNKGYYLTIAVDVDSVVADICVPWLDRYNRDYDDNLTPNDLRAWNTALFVKPECGEKIFDYIEDPTLYDEMPLVKGAEKGIFTLRQDLGCRVVFVTASTLGASGRKYRYLKDHNLIFDLDDYVEARDKSLISADFLLDDRYENCCGFFGIGVLFTQPWNRMYTEYPYRVNSWEEFTQMIEKEIHG